MENNSKTILDPVPLISRITNMLLSPRDKGIEGIDRRLLEALTMITGFFNVDFAYIQLYLNPGKIVMTHECRANVESAIFFPMLYGEQPIGILGIDSNKETFNESGIKTLEIISTILCSALEREEREREYLFNTLTPAEKNIFELFAQGKKSSEIARQRNMQIESVYVVSSRIRKKLNLGTNGGIHDWAVRESKATQGASLSEWG
ncbi:MAG: hypothetical protein GY754_25040 [bacterium]|nr:hypothetical protein [bacterium]